MVRILTDISQSSYEEEIHCLEEKVSDYLKIRILTGISQSSYEEAIHCLEEKVSDYLKNGAWSLHGNMTLIFDARTLEYIASYTIVNN